jgi:hypothetical protein
MKHMFIIAGAAAFAAASPAVAKPDHAKGHGKAAHAQGHKGQGTLYGYGVGGCPPGLHRKNNGCMPPGQFKKLYNVGQRFPSRYGSLWNYNQIPYDLRQQYGFDPGYRYYYGDGYLYRVDPKTMLISQVVNAILR